MQYVFLIYACFFHSNRPFLEKKSVTSMLSILLEIQVIRDKNQKKKRGFPGFQRGSLLKAVEIRGDQLETKLILLIFTFQVDFLNKNRLSSAWKLQFLFWKTPICVYFQKKKAQNLY